MPQPKILYFLSHPIQYFSPLLVALGKKTGLEVRYFSDVSVKGMQDKGFGVSVQWDMPLLDNYSNKTLKNWTGRKSLSNRFFDVFNPSVVSEISKFPGKVVIINGWSYSSNWLAIIFGKLLGKEVWMRAESPLNQEMLKSAKVKALKKIFLGKFMFRFLIDRFLYIGSQNKAFYQYHGIADENRLIYTPYCVDNQHFQEKMRQYRDDVERLKQARGLSGKKVILFSGKYIGKKRPLDLLAAFGQLSNNDYALVMVGEGELRTEMETYISANQLKNVFLTGFVNQSDIPQYYALADVFVMCSGLGETWGLSVNEAMNFGLPVVVSETCGCSFDLVKNGWNGYTFKEGDVKSLATHLEHILADDNLRTQMGQNSISRINEFSIDRCVEEIIKHVR